METVTKKFEKLGKLLWVYDQLKIEFHKHHNKYLHYRMLIGEKVFDDIEKKDLAQTLKYLHRKYIQYINWAKREGTDRAKKLLQKLNEIALTDEDIVTMNTEKNDMNLAYMSVANIKGFEI